MTKNALIVIDMLNEYLEPSGKVYCEKCREIIPHIVKCIEYARQHNVLVVYSNTSLNNKNDVMVKKWGLHAVEGTKGAEVIKELAPKKGDLVVNKKGYNGFFNSNLHSELQARGVKRVAISGIHTHVCVLLTAVGAFENGYDVITLEDCITTGYQPNHESRLRFFGTHLGSLMSSVEWMQQLDAGK